MRTKLPVVLSAVMSFVCSCMSNPDLERSLCSAGPNRAELEEVLSHYRTVDANPDKLRSAEFLIANLPAHYSYADAEIHDFYGYAAKVLANKNLTPEQQRDSLLAITNLKYRDLPNHTVPDAQIIKADYLIDNIDKAYSQWTTCPWANHLTFDEYLEWMLPYKIVELQEMDHWRDTLYARLGAPCLEHRDELKNDVEFNNAVHVADTTRYCANKVINRCILPTDNVLPLLSDHLLANMTYGSSSDYARMLALLIRSLGVPAVLDERPVGPRYSAPTQWVVILSNFGYQLTSSWDFSTTIGEGFFPYERGPKVYRITYAINKEREEYMRKAKYKYPFELGRQDVTSRYYLTSDLSLPVDNAKRKMLKDKYIYIASAVRDENTPWQIVDFGQIKNGKACFKDMGREVLYSVMGYDGNDLIQITEPFILHKDGSVEYVNADTISSQSLDKWKNYAL